VIGLLEETKRHKRSRAVGRMALAEAQKRIDT
jgi:hypothetical protein